MREREETECSGGKRLAIISGGGGKEVTKQLKIPRQCRLIRLTRVSQTEGKALGREKGKATGRIIFSENGAQERI
jgi:hypothetical protein